MAVLCCLLIDDAKKSHTRPAAADPPDCSHTGRGETLAHPASLLPLFDAVPNQALFHILEFCSHARCPLRKATQVSWEGELLRGQLW